MIKNYFKVAFRQIVGHKGYSAINALGLSVGFACCLIIFLFVFEEYTFDAFHAKSDSLYRLVTHEQRPDGERIGSGMAMPVAPVIGEEASAVRHAVRILDGGATVRVGDDRFSERMLFTDAGFFDMFSFPLIAGDPTTALQSTDNVVITKATAVRLFGQEDVVGRPLLIRIGADFENFTITGVAEAPPKNSSIRFEMVTRFEHHPFYADDHDNPNSFNHEVFLELQPDADFATAREQVEKSTKKVLAGLVAYLNERLDKDPVTGDAFRVELQPIRDMHLDSRITTGGASNPSFSLIMGLVALMVLASGCINFVNLSIGRAATRMREVGIRKVVGAGRAQLFRQFWSESAIVCLLALGLGFVMAEFGLPYFNEFLRRDLTLDLAGNWPLWGAMVGLLALTAFIAGGYPALLMTRFQPARVLKGHSGAIGRGRLRGGLIVVQFVFAVLFVTSLFTMNRQLRFLQNADTGFDREQVVTIPISTSQQDDVFVQSYKERIRQIPGVVDASAASNSLGIGPDGGRSTSIVTFSNGDGEIPAHILRIDPDYLETLGLDLVWGRNLSNSEGDKRAVLVNETLVSRLANPPDEASRLEGFEMLGEEPEIAGVVKDFNFQPLRQAIQPLVMYTAPHAPIMKMFVRIHPDRVPETLASLEAAWKELAPGRPFQSSFLDEDVDRQYQQEARQIQIAGIAMALAMLIACFGLLGLAVLSAARRTKEIGIRKALGASVSGLVMLLSREFLQLVAIAIVFAAPLAWFLMDEWLAQFAYRTTMNIGVVLMAGGAVVAVAWLTVGWQAVRAARASPVKCLRYE